MAEVTILPTERCEGCGREVPKRTMTHFGSADSRVEIICLRCFNERCADQMGIDGFEHVDFEPIVIDDFAGVEHTFLIQLRLYPTGVGIYASEVLHATPDGYEFAVNGDFLDDAMELLAKLVTKIRLNLARQHIVDDGHGAQVKEQTLRGHISSGYDVGAGEPVFVIDGQPVSLDELGRMLLSFEGWHFRLEILDKFEES